MNGKQKAKQPPKRIQNVFVLLLLAVFAMACVVMVALGARAYLNTVESADRSNAVRILSALVQGAVRSEDQTVGDPEQNALMIERQGELSVLTFVNDYDGEIYYRRIFCADGYLRESLTSEEMEFQRDLGEPLIPARAFEPRLEGNLLTVRLVTEKGEEKEVRVSLRAGGETR